MEVPTTPTPNGHHLPPIPDAGPRGPALSRRTSPPFPRRPSERDRQCSTQTPTRQWTVRPARLPRPSQGRQPARCRGDSTPRIHGQGDPRPTNGPNRGRGDKPLNAPPPQAGRHDTSPGHGHRPPDQLGPYTTGFPTAATTQPNRRGAEDTPRQREHDAGGPGADKEMTETSGPQKSGGSPPIAASCSMPQQREPSTGNIPEGHLGTTPAHPSPTGTTLDQNRETMPPPPPTPPQRRNTDPFDDAELRAVYGMHANTPSSGLVAALREHLQDVKSKRLFAVVPLPHAATTDIFVRQLQALVTPQTQIVDDLVHAWMWWFNANQLDLGGVWVPHLGWAHTLRAPPTDPRPAPNTGGRKWAAPQPRANTLNIPLYKDLAHWQSRTARDRGRNLRNMVERYPPGAGTARAGPPRREGDPEPSP